MHLATNVLAQRILPAGFKVRRSFSFQAGEKSSVNRWYRAAVDRRNGSPRPASGRTGWEEACSEAAIQGDWLGRAVRDRWSAHAFKGYSVIRLGR